MHKPVWAACAFLTKLNGGDAEWLREKFNPLRLLTVAIDSHTAIRRRLYFWIRLLKVGVTTSLDVLSPQEPFRFDFSELHDVSRAESHGISGGRLKISRDRASYQKMADELLAHPQALLGSEGTLYYSVDLDLRPYARPASTKELHIGGPRNWDCLIQRLGVWSGFLACGRRWRRRRKRFMVEKNYRDPGRSMRRRRRARCPRWRRCMTARRGQSLTGSGIGSTLYLTFRGW
jgi:putative isomerase